MHKLRVRVTRELTEEAFVEIELPGDPPPPADTCEEYEKNWEYQEEIYRRAIAEAEKGCTVWKHVETSHPHVTQASWDQTHEQDAECVCGHRYYRHFDTYDNMSPVGCKYCECRFFRSKEKHE